MAREPFTGESWRKFCARMDNCLIGGSESLSVADHAAGCTQTFSSLVPSSHSKVHFRDCGAFRIQCKTRKTREQAHLIGEALDDLRRDTLQEGYAFLEDAVSSPRFRSEQSIVHLLQGDILEPEHPGSVMVRDYNTVHVANSHLEAGVDQREKKIKKTLPSPTYPYFKKADRIRS
jgi:hypothetical protein